MTKDEFRAWYKQHIEIMALMGVFHPDSPSGKTVHLSLASVQPMITDLDERLKQIEDRLDLLIDGKVRERPVEAPKPKIVEPPVMEEKKPVKKSVTKKRAAPKSKAAPKKETKKPVSSGWQI
jgi:hypothetical protein